ncbi:Transcription factor mbp1 (MBF subunit p120) [Saitoella coloradoensis]
MPEIYKATYSGVPVFEYLAKGIACMRRRSDGWLNATQILKVAGFDKPQRTRILERDVQKGTHEKVQGGYGKYQGTWVPLERGRQIASQYGIEGILQPIIDFRETSESPPLAPKHITAASTRTKAAPKTKAAVAKRAAAAPVPRVMAPPPRPVLPDSESDLEDGDVSDESLGSGSGSASHSRASSPGVYSHVSQSTNGVLGKRKRQTAGHEAANESYTEQLLQYFIQPIEEHFPQFLYRPLPNFDANSIIDEEGHTAFHWACAMATVEVAQLLKEAGADISLANAQGQTPLMRAIMFTNNYEQRTFSRLVDMLQSTVYCMDRYGQTVFHHIALTTTTRSKLAAARNYIELLLAKLAETQSKEQIGRILDMRNLEGDTALLICARNGARKCARVMMDFLANPGIPNNQGHTATEYINQHDQMRTAGAIPTFSNMSTSPPPGNQSIQQLLHGAQHVEAQEPTFVYAPAKSIMQDVLPDIGKRLRSLADAYEKELKEKDADLRQSQDVLQTTEAETEATTQQLDSLNPAMQEAEAQQSFQQVNVLTQRLRAVMERNQAKDLAKLVQEEEHRAKALHSPAGNGDDAEKYQLMEELASLQRERRALVSEQVELSAAAGVGERMSDYRRLIAICCNIRVEEVDGLLDDLLDSLQSLTPTGREDSVF